MVKMLCPRPECDGTMKRNKDRVYACEKCGGAFVPKERHSGRDSMFGVT